jgi:hypothetical protein
MGPEALFSLSFGCHWHGRRSLLCLLFCSFSLRVSVSTCKSNYKSAIRRTKSGLELNHHRSKLPMANRHQAKCHSWLCLLCWTNWFGSTLCGSTSKNIYKTLFFLPFHRVFLSSRNFNSTKKEGTPKKSMSIVLFFVVSIQKKTKNNDHQHLHPLSSLIIICL